jgi:hypothetical protein
MEFLILALFPFLGLIFVCAAWFDGIFDEPPMGRFDSRLNQKCPACGGDDIMECDCHDQ